MQEFGERIRAVGPGGIFISDAVIKNTDATISYSRKRQKLTGS